MKYLFLALFTIFLIGCSENSVNPTQPQTDKQNIETQYPLVITVTDIYNNTVVYECSDVTYMPIGHSYILHITTKECGYSYPIENVQNFTISPIR